MGRIVAGIDVGSRMTKALLLEEDGAGTGFGAILARASTVTGAWFARAAETAFAQALAQAGLAREQVAYVVSTGYGRTQVPFRDLQLTEITSHATGAVRLFPLTRTVLDVGAQNARAIQVTEEGRVKSFRMNDKCASGTGRFLERVARALEVELDEIGPLSLRSREPRQISSICAVLAESEVINLVTQDAPIEDILRGTHLSISERLMGLVRQVGVRPEVTLTGGVTKNPGLVKALEERLGLPLNVCADSEYAGTLGAALLGFVRLRKKEKETAA
ncbi:MAG: 2-hydroxyglutaryl-CoA dehydratase [Acidobacteria bacterium]|nr:2-hydroxyglutaryl-CoA dehydratase [Acidobacteriota bacterium]